MLHRRHGDFLIWRVWWMILFPQREWKGLCVHVCFLCLCICVSGWECISQTQTHGSDKSLEGTGTKACHGTFSCHQLTLKSAPLCSTSTEFNSTGCSQRSVSKKADIRCTVIWWTKKKKWSPFLSTLNTETCFDSSFFPVTQCGIHARTLMKGHGG